MPELPDIVVYIECLERRVRGQVLEKIRLFSPFVLRSVEPPLSEVEGKTVRRLRRLGKRIVFEFDEQLFLVQHLMIAGRLHWKPKGAKPPGKIGLAAFDFASGMLIFTEAGTKKRASLHLVRGQDNLSAHQPGGLEPLDADLKSFRQALNRENHTLKRALTDPHLFSGIGNAYSDEILHQARLSPLTWTSRLAIDTERMDRAPASRSRRRLSRRSNRVSSRNGRSRPLPQALPRLRHSRPAYHLR
jgi:formamidopyrimidine-DNA glycosylase